MYPLDGDDVHSLLRNANIALYRAKEEGRNNFKHYSPAMIANNFERLALGNRRHKALAPCPDIVQADR